LKPGTTQPLPDRKAQFEREQVDGTWHAGPCRVSAPLPADYPAPTAPGAIELKAYPVVRKAQATALLGPEIGRNLAFWKLFRHIQSHAIAMTAPVEMRLDPKAGDPSEPSSPAGRWPSSIASRRSASSAPTERSPWSRRRPSR
jgi:hypothetical protein